MFRTVKNKIFIISERQKEKICAIQGETRLGWKSGLPIFVECHAGKIAVFNCVLYDVSRRMANKTLFYSIDEGDLQLEKRGNIRNLRNRDPENESRG